MRGDGFTGIGGTGWVETAVVTDERADAPLIQLDNEDQHLLHDDVSVCIVALLHRR